MSHFWSSAAT